LKEQEIDVKDKIQSDSIDINGIFLILKHKIFFFLLVTLIVSTLLIDKTLKQTVLFSTQGLVYVEKEGDFLDLKDKVLKKILPDYDDESRKELINEYFTSPIVIQNAIVKSGYNVFVSEKRDAEYKIATFLTWNSTYHKDVKNLIPSNENGDLYVDNATINNVYTEKIQLVIKFVDYNEFKVFSKIGSKYITTSQVDKVTKIKDLCSFTLHRKEKKEQDYFDPISPLLQLPEPIYITINNPSLYEKDIEDNLEISGASSALISLETTGDNPYMLSKLTNNLIDEFIHFNINIKLKNIDKVYNFMLEERKSLGERRDAYLSELKEIRKKTQSVIDLNFFKTSSQENSTLKAAIRKNEIEIKRLEVYRKHLIETKDITKMTLSDRPVFSSIAAVSTKVDDVLGKFLIIQTKYTPNSLVYKNAKKLVEKQKDLLILDIGYKIEELKMKNERIIKSYNNAKDEVIQSIEIKDKVDFIKNHIKMIEVNYKQLYESERNLLYNKVFIKYSNRKLRDAMVAKKPTNKVTGKIVVNILIGIVIGIIATIIKHLLFPLFLSRVVVSKMTSSKIMGGIPKISKNSITPEGLINFTKEDKIAELFTTMQTLIFFNHPEIKTIQFTSPYPKDGKTFAARNVAQSLASSNAKVILVNMDLDFEKKQKLKKIDSAKDLKKSIKKIKLYNKKDLYILPFNTTEKNMQIDAKLEKYKQIFASLKNSFDYIILDTPQYPMYSESLSLSTIVDLSISVVKLNHTPAKVSGKHFRDISRFSKKHIILINNDLIDINSSGYSFVDESNIKHNFERLKQKISQI